MQHATRGTPSTTKDISFKELGKMPAQGKTSNMFVDACRTLAVFVQQLMDVSEFKRKY